MMLRCISVEQAISVSRPGNKCYLYRLVSVDKNIEPFFDIIMVSHGNGEEFKCGYEYKLFEGA